MTEAGGPFDAWGSSLIGGAGGALIAVAAVFVAQWLADRRRVAIQRRNAGNDLIIQISNLRDDACSRRNGLAGDYALFPLRNSLFITHVELERFPSYQEVRSFYQAVRAWREWIRDHQPPNPPSSRRDDAEYARLREYQGVLRTWSDELIIVLQDDLLEPSLRWRHPTLPPLSA